MQVTTVGLDLAKSVFQVHAVDEEGRVVVRKALRQAQVCSSSPGFPPASSAWKLAAHRIIGPAS